MTKTRSKTPDLLKDARTGIGLRAPHTEQILNEHKNLK